MLPHLCVFFLLFPFTCPTQGMSLHPGVEDKSLSKPQLESINSSLWSGLVPSRPGLQHRNHTGIFYPGEEDQASV